ncbi:MAG: glycosyltransferase family 39 protein [Chloroflexi bacterium]|nr:glycosyltransferase family 39 protein [Chloroflexota bacterium]
MKFHLSPVVVNISILLILVLATLLRLINAESDPFWVDERGHLEVALSADISDLFTGVREHAAAAPLDYLLLRFYQRLTGAETRFELRLPYVFYGLLSVYLIYQLGRLIFNPIIGLIGAYTMSISAFHVYYSQEVRFYSLSALIGLLSTLLFLTAWKRPSWLRWVLWGFVCLLGLYTHYFLALVFFVQLGWLLANEFGKRPDPKSKLFKSLFLPCVVFTISLLAFLPWFLWAANAPLNNFPELGISFGQALFIFISALGPSLAFLVFSPFGVFFEKRKLASAEFVIRPFPRCLYCRQLSWVFLQRPPGNFCIAVLDPPEFG